MRRLMMAGLGVLALLLVAGPVWAGEGGEKQGRMRERMKERMEQRQERRGQRVQAFKQIEGLTDEQKAKIRELHKGLREKRKATKTPEERAKLIATVREEVEKVLTEEQLAKLKKLRQAALAERDPLNKLSLTEDQKAKIAELRKAAAEKAKATEDREERVKIFATLRQDVKKLLTEEQVKKLEAARPRPGRRPGPRRRANQRDEKQGDEDPKPVFD